ncbi:MULTISPECIES: Rrf2 family transcriptional regulator [Paenibacillus]|uniref:Rrf2 family transcriptional regulator n=1 Tax=Paenibacillus agri TaxID=2744309 RepID=A0A850EUC5_9BACL|nr:Rrf2 family transcriptional regulator [Paenibacillus agri]NUU63460.1 Rrf2 family transcriptional regulator [Paenibacillus agri]
MTKTRNTGSLQYKSFGLALQAMVILARKATTCSSCEMAELLDSEATALRRILASLVRDQLLVTREGRDGGYILNKAPEDITLAEIYRALEVGESRNKAVSETICDSKFGNRMKEACDDILDEMDQSVVAVLEQHTLADLAAKTDC